MSLTKGLNRESCNKLYQEILESKDVNAQKSLCTNDLFYLLTIGCKRKDIDNDWLFERCREVEESPDGHLDLWAREHYKSTIITYGLTMKELLGNPNLTFGIFSHTRPIAKAFLDQIKREFESNTYLQAVFQDVLYQNPKSEAEKWSLDSGIILKRENNPKESSIEAWGLVDGQPTSKHFDRLLYDDVVTRESVTTPEQIKKTTEALELSYNLGAKGGVRRFIGTRYHANDSYQTLMKRGTVIPRIKPARVGGKIDGAPVFLTDDELKKKRRDMGPYTFGCQMLQNPTADKAMGFQKEWLKYYKRIEWEKYNKYIFVDPAGEKKKDNDYTVIAVVGLAPDQNYYLIDMVRDRLNLTERTEKLFELHRKYTPLDVGYEKYGKDSDIEHIEYVQEQENYRFNITALGGSLAKEDRIRKLIPIFEQHRYWLPERLEYVNYEDQRRDLIKDFVEDEYDPFPVSTHDDMLDTLARVMDPKIDAKFPKEKKPKASRPRRAGSWMG